MDKEQEIPEKRFEQYEEVFNSEGVAIGFTLPNLQFLFKYDSEGGWRDQKGNYYNSKGVLQKVNDQHSQEDEEEADQQILDQFQRMLDDQVPQNKAKKQANKQNKKANKQQTPQNYRTQSVSLLQKYTKKQSIREGLPQQLHIYFKMRSKFYHRIKPSVEKTQSVNQANAEIKKIKDEAIQQGKKLSQKNKWLAENGQFQYSGTQLDEATYDRYWYGYIKANPQNYQQIVSQISKSEEFALLQSKSYYALKSKFYLKKKMQQTIQKLRQQLNGKQDNDLFKIKLSNLPENFPCSFVLDLCTFSGVSVDEIYGIYLIDQYTAELLISKKGAQKFINVQGYCHDEKQYIELDVELDKQKRKFKNQGFFKVSVATDKKNPYKTHTRQLNDTLALQKSRQQLVKLYTQQQQKENGGYRFIFGKIALKKVLMFRGSSLDVLKIQAFVK